MLKNFHAKWYDFHLKGIGRLMINNHKEYLVEMAAWITLDSEITPEWTCIVMEEAHLQISSLPAYSCLLVSPLTT